MVRNGQKHQHRIVSIKNTSASHRYQKLTIVQVYYSVSDLWNPAQAMNIWSLIVYFGSFQPTFNLQVNSCLVWLKGRKCGFFSIFVCIVCPSSISPAWLHGPCPARPSSSWFLSCAAQPRAGCRLDGSPAKAPSSWASSDHLSCTWSWIIWLVSIHLCL